MYKIFLLLSVMYIGYGCNNNQNKPDTENTAGQTQQAGPAQMHYNVLNVFPHDTSSFTEGLLLHNGFLYEGTGMEGKSHLLKTELKTGKILQQKSLPADMFGEGISIIGDTVYQLTWEDHLVHVYELSSFKKIKEFNWPYQGWGMTTNGSELFISTGSNNIYVVNPADFKIKRIISVSDNNGPLANINELELVDGFIYANVWQTDYIIKIDMNTGNVVAKADLSDIWKKSNIAEPAQKDVLNGIAYDAATKRFYVTGKYWPNVFEIDLQ